MQRSSPRHIPYSSGGVCVKVRIVTNKIKIAAEKYLLMLRLSSCARRLNRRQTSLDYRILSAGGTGIFVQL